MATPGLLSSSPARVAYHDPVVLISSSPEFPSICELLPKPTKKPPLRSGSNAAPVPQGAPTAFTTASAIRRAEQDAATERQSPGPTTALPPKPAADPANNGIRRAKGKARAVEESTRKVKAQQSKAEDATGAPPTDNPAAEVPAKKPARKPRQTKDGVTAQTRLPKGKVTKPAPKETQIRKKAETVSRHFAPQHPAPAPPRELPANPIDDEPVTLEPALRRRLDWTPPREKAPMPCLADSSAIKELSSSVLPAHGDVFKTLQDTYCRNLDADLNGSAALPSANADVLGKRKLIEMVAAPGNKQKTPEPSPTKPKAAKKKPRTITELATAAYRLPEVEDVSTEEPRQDSLLGYLETTNGEAEPGSKGVGAKGKASRRPAKARPKQPKKDQAPKQFLLSPTSAMRQVARQDFVFGTASQLATEDDPQLLRSLHEAMKASNQPDSDPFVSPAPPNSNLAIRKRQGPGLWAAGARYDDGDLLDMEVLDLTRSSPLALAHLLQKAPCAGQETVQGRTSGKVCVEIEMSDDSLEISNSAPISHPKRPLLSAICPVSPAMQLDDTTPSNQSRPQTAASETDFQPPPSNQEQHQLLLSQTNSPRQEQSQMPPRPNFELYTDARLAKEVASYGFKVVKKRAAMVALLNQCWDSQHKTCLGSRTAQVTMSTMTLSQAASPSRARGRPKSDSLASASAPVGPPTAGSPARNKCVSDSIPGSAPLEVAKRPRGRPRKASVASSSEVTGAVAPPRLGRKKSASVSEVESDPPVEKRPRGRTTNDAAASPAKRSPAKAPASPKRASAASNPTAPAPATPRRRKAAAKSAIEIPDSDIDDPFASSPASSPLTQDDVFSPPAMDLSVTEDTESSLIASPTTQQVSLFRYITQAVVSAPPTKDPANPSWHEKMLMYDPIILEDLTAWLNSGQLDRVGYDGEVAPGDVKKWCESKSVCCLWRVNLRGKERKRL